jgi:CRISPR-associated protein Cmr2
MQAGLYNQLEAHRMKMNAQKDPSWIIHLFGNDKEEGECFRRGALVCYPTWFSRIDFEVINPHSRSRRAGTQPIFYEVVPAETKGRLQLLYAPLPGEIKTPETGPPEFVELFIDAITVLLERYGISAKRTAGWGTARIETWKGFVKVSDQAPKAERPSLKKRKKTLHSFQELKSLVSKTPSPGSFTSTDAEKFKAELKSRIAGRGIGR